MQDIDNFLDLVLEKIKFSDKVIKNNHPGKGYWISPSYCDKAYYKRRKDLGYKDLPYCSKFGDYVYLIHCVSKRIAHIKVSEKHNLVSVEIKTDLTNQRYYFDNVLDGMVIDKLDKILVSEAEIRLLES